MSELMSTGDLPGKSKGRRLTFYIILIAAALFLLKALTDFVLRQGRDVSAEIVQIDDLDSIASDANVLPDMRYFINKKQEEAVFPVEENGWRLLLEAFGPKALCQENLADRIPWEEFPTTDDSKSWFEDVWTPICAKMNVDPTAKPKFIERLNPIDFLVKNGAQIEETPLDESDAAPDAEGDDRYYYEGGSRELGRLSLREAEAIYADLCARPWSTGESPTLARWIEENADQYDVLADAFRRPKCACWHILPKYPETTLQTLFPDVQNTRDFARIVALRMNYRIGEGDLSGALDDFETTLLMARSLLQKESPRVVETLTGCAILTDALGARFFHNPDVAMSAEQSVRCLSLVRDLTTDAFWRDAWQADGERYMLEALVADALQARRGETGFFTELLRYKQTNNNVGGHMELGRLVLGIASLRIASLDREFSRAPISDAEFFWEFHALLRETMSLSKDARAQAIENWSAKQEKAKHRARLKFVGLTIDLIAPDGGQIRAAAERQASLCRMATVGQTFLAYQTEHGTLPPTFTRDAQGRALHSWRVLVLPYLGEEGKALYAQIHLDEPWDSPFNSQFHEAIPEVYVEPKFGDSKSKSNVDGATRLTVLSGWEQFFDPTGKGKDWRAQVKRENRNGIGQALVMERLEPICWMRPEAEIKLKYEDPKPIAAGSSGEGDSNRTNVDRRLELNLSDLLYQLQKQSRGWAYVSASGGAGYISEMASPEEWREIIEGTVGE